MSTLGWGVGLILISILLGSLIRILVFKLHPAAASMAEQGERVSTKLDFIAFIPWLIGIVKLFQVSILYGILGIIFSVVIYPILGGVIIHIFIDND